ncbi:MAG: DUF222 domain-containing protein [Chloroflexi bacterium]|nr:MAG: DUF222 domain-containing protein [Chloroflexota bacterium]
MRSELVDALVVHVADEDIERLTDTALGEEIVELRRAIDRFEFQCSRRLDLFARRQGFLAFGFVSLISWLRRACRLMPGVAVQHAEVARNLASLPQTSTALAAGEIGFHHAAVIAHSVTEVGAEAVVRHEPALLEAAQNHDPRNLRHVTNVIRYCEDPDGTLAEANDDYKRRYLHLSQSWHGMFYIEGRLDAEGGAVLQTALNALEEEWFVGDERTGIQRRADALVELARQRLDVGTLPEVGGQKPHLAVTASVATLKKEPGAPPADLEWSQPITADAARRVACDCAMTRVLLGPTSEPIDVGRCSRTIPPALRRALVVRDKGCRFPGCDRPPDWCDGHHLIHWIEGGETSLSNTCLLCRRHHRFVHELGWELSWGAEGAILAIKPWWLKNGAFSGVAPPLVSSGSPDSQEQLSTGATQPPGLRTN